MPRLKTKQAAPAASTGTTVGYEANRAKRVLSRLCGYFPSQFASAAGKTGGELYTPRRVIKLPVEMLTPFCWVIRAGPVANSLA